jgi:hypothetical protein
MAIPCFQMLYVWIPWHFWPSLFITLSVQFISPVGSNIKHDPEPSPFSLFSLLLASPSPLSIHFCFDSTNSSQWQPKKVTDRSQTMLSSDQYWFVVSHLRKIPNTLKWPTRYYILCLLSLYFSLTCMPFSPPCLGSAPAPWSPCCFWICQPKSSTRDSPLVRTFDQHPELPTHCFIFLTSP